MSNLADLHPSLWPAASLTAHQPPSLPTGHAALDAQLPGGGWPAACLTELLVRAMGLGELRLLAPALRRLAQSGKQILLLAPPQLPYGPALAALGLPPEQFLVVRAKNTADKLWALEQSLKSNSFGALLAWLDEPTRPEHIRRFQLAARQAKGPVFLFRPLAVQHQASAAPLRLALLPRQYPGLAVQLLKRRGPVNEAPLLLNLPLPSRALRPLAEESVSLPLSPTSAGPARPAAAIRPSLSTAQIQGLSHALDRLPLPGRSLQPQRPSHCA